MTEFLGPAVTTRASRIIPAPPDVVYGAFLARDAVAAWLPPDGMTGEIHDFDAQEGGSFRMTLTYQSAEGRPGGKTTEDSDTFRVRILRLVPHEMILQAARFESHDAAYAGEMRMTVRLARVAGGTEVTLLHEGLPPAVRPEDDAAGMESSLRNLAAFLERTSPPSAAHGPAPPNR